MKGIGMTDKESGPEWKQVENYPMYDVSSDGHVRTHQRKLRNNSILKPGISKAGYARVVLCNDGTKRNIPVHRIVAEAFIPNPENKPQVNHKDGNKLNNDVSNLEWCTASENVQHSFDVLGHERQNGGMNKLSQEQVEFLRIKAANGELTTYTEFAKMFNVSERTIANAVRGDSNHYAWVTTVPPVTENRDPGVPKKLTPDQVREVRRRFKNGESSHALAKEFGISQSKLYLAATGKSYQSIPMDDNE